MANYQFDLVLITVGAIKIDRFENQVYYNVPVHFFFKKKKKFNELRKSLSTSD